MAQIIKIDAKKPQIINRKRVAAYARVSMATDRLEHSLSAQISYYSRLIQKNPEWIYAGVYSDNGISGTRVAKRQGFQEMMADADAGKIDIILTKSISRFARNTVDLLKSVRHLKDIGVEVRFEKEHINSFSSDGELMLTVLASFAQEESISISNNVKWATTKRFEAGIPNGKFRIYGYRWQDNKLVIVPEEAAIVKRIYQNFLDGKSRLETEREFDAEGIRTREGCRWTDSNIKVILTNITYTGNMLLQKEYIDSPITKHRKKNHGELPQYFVQNTHEPIISMETFKYVQDEMARRRKLGCFANKSLKLSCFSTKIKCGCCGRSFVKDTRKNRAKMSRLGEKYVQWECTSKKKGDSSCKSGTIREDVLKEECAKVLGLDEFDEKIFSEKVKQITIPEKGILVFEFNDGSILEHHWMRNSRKDCWTPEYRKVASEHRRNHAAKRNGTSCFTTKIRCEYCGCNYQKQTQKMADGSKRSYWRCSEGKKCTVFGLKDDEIRKMSAEVLGIEKFDDSVFLEQIDFISVRNQRHLTFHFIDGHTVEREYTAKKGGHPCSDETRKKISAANKKVWENEERHKQMSEQMKQIRKERGKEWRIQK